MIYIKRFSIIEKPLCIFLFVFLFSKCLADNFLIINWKLSDNLLRLLKKDLYEMVVRFPNGVEEILQQPKSYRLHRDADVLVSEIYLRARSPYAKLSKIPVFSQIRISDLRKTYKEHFRWHNNQYHTRQKVYHIMFYQQENIIRKTFALGTVSHSTRQCELIDQQSVSLRSVFEYNPSNYSHFVAINYPNMELFSEPSCISKFYKTMYEKFFG
ncbi:MAG: hypothetical protein HRT87_01460 [Legionellales bacterium]|nr:hypothetical protein [Legionellales bacterium]